MLGLSKCSHWLSPSSLGHLHSFLSPTNLWEHSLPGIPSDHSGLGTYISALVNPLTHIREVSSCHRCGQTERNTAGQCADLEHFILNRTSSSKLSCQGQGICVEEVTDDHKRTVWHRHKGLMHIRAHMGCESMHRPAQIQVSRVPGTKKASTPEVSTLTRKLFAINTLANRKSVFSDGS